MEVVWEQASTSQATNLTEFWDKSPSNASNFQPLLGNQSYAEQMLYHLNLYQPYIRLDEATAVIYSVVLAMHGITHPHAMRANYECGTEIPGVALYLTFMTRSSSFYPYYQLSRLISCVGCTLSVFKNANSFCCP